MGKPFARELEHLPSTIKWASTQDVTELRTFMVNTPNVPLLCIGSGGSSSACYFASILYRDFCGVAVAITPLMLQQMNAITLTLSKQLYISASGNNKDIIQAFKKGSSFNESCSASLCTSTRNKLESQALSKPNHQLFHYNSPIGKDGFLATNSLVAFFVFLIKAFDDSSNFINVIEDFKFSNLYEHKNISSFQNINNFIVIYGKWGEPIAVDIESKLSEAGLAASMICDFRNFGHGRHNWFDKRRENSCLIAILTKEDELLANKTIENLPKDIPIVFIRSPYEKYMASLDLLIKSFFFVEMLGQNKGIDPGRPGIPEYGSVLYNLSYQKLIQKSETLPSWKETAICRKAHIANIKTLSTAEQSFFESHLENFVRRINKTKFEMIAFDYDGTLNGYDKESRYCKTLHPNIKEPLIELLSAGVKIAVVSGRGKSIRDILNTEIPEKYKHLVYVGHYNGSIIYPLATRQNIAQIKNLQLEGHLSELIEQLLMSCPFVKKNDIDSRQYQVTITTRDHSTHIANRCREIIFNNGWHDVAIWESSHSIDIVILSYVNKSNILKFIQGSVLCIGDCGSLAGNDYQLLSTTYSLSVGSVSYDPNSCWNLAPVGCTGVNATIYYLKKMKLTDAKVTLNF